MIAQTQIIAPPAPVDLSEFVSIDRAALAMEISEGHLARRCRSELVEKGLAKLTTPPDGGQPRWYLNRAVDPRIASDAGENRLNDLDLSSFSGRRRAEAMKRRACVLALRELRRNAIGTLKDELPSLCVELAKRFDLKSLSPRALYKWDRLYRCPADLAKLVDLRGGDRRGDDDPAAWQEFRRLFLHANAPSIKACWREVQHLAKLEGWKWCGLDSCKKQLDNRIAPEVQALHREPAKWRQHLAPTIAQDPEAWGAGECWVSDHKQLDVWCRFGGEIIRPWLTTWMCWRTRRICGWVLTDNPNSTTILAALRHGLIEHRDKNFGGPSHVWTDHGKDYEAWFWHGATKKQRRAKINPSVNEGEVAATLASAGIGISFSLFGALQIETHFAKPYNPNGKARLERWFRTLEGFCKCFDTYAGRNTETRPEKLNEILKSGRVPRFESILARLTDHINGYNADADHCRADCDDEETGERLSPDEAMARNCKTRRVMVDENVLQSLLQHWHQPVFVGRNGVAIRIHGRTIHYGQFNPALTPFKAVRKSDRRPVIITYDPQNIERIWVRDEQLRLVCVAEMNQIGGRHGADAVSREHVARLNKEQAAYNRSLKIINDRDIMTIAQTHEERLADIAARQSRRLQPEPPPAMRIVQTPLDGQAAEIQSAELRSAVGDGTTPARRRSAMDRMLAAGRPVAATPRRSRDVYTLANLNREADGNG